MDIPVFLNKFAELLSQTSADAISPDTEFKKLPDWSSLVALSVIAMVEDEYGVLLKSTDIRNASTLGDLASAIEAAR